MPFSSWSDGIRITSQNHDGNQPGVGKKRDVYNNYTTFKTRLQAQTATDLLFPPLGLKGDAQRKVVRVRLAFRVQTGISAKTLLFSSQRKFAQRSLRMLIKLDSRPRLELADITHTFLCLINGFAIFKRSNSHRLRSPPRARF